MFGFQFRSQERREEARGRQEEARDESDAEADGDDERDEGGGSSGSESHVDEFDDDLEYAAGVLGGMRTCSAARGGADGPDALYDGDSDIADEEEEEPAAAEMDNGAEMRWARSLVANQAKSEKSARKRRSRGQGGRFVEKQPAPEDRDEEEERPELRHHQPKRRHYREEERRRKEAERQRQKRVEKRAERLERLKHAQEILSRVLATDDLKSIIKEDEMVLKAKGQVTCGFVCVWEDGPGLPPIFLLFVK